MPKFPPSKLSDLVIDIDKDWDAKKIENLGIPDSGDSALPRGLVDIYACDYGLNWVDLGVIASNTIHAMAYLGNGIAILGDAADHIYRSTDYGLNWADLGTFGIMGFACMAYLGDGIAVAGSGKRIYRSTDYGATWANLGDISVNDSIEGMAYLGNGIAIAADWDWATGDSNVYRSTDYGATWANLGVVGECWGIYAMAYLGNGIAIWGDAAQHIYRSTDYGATWTDLGVIASGCIYAMAYLGNGIAILGDASKHIYRSTDYGATWTDLGVITTGTIYVMAYLGNGIAILGELVGGGSRVYRSTDYGATWTDLGVISTGSIYAMAYLGNGIAILGDAARHIYRSTSAFQLSNFNPNQFDKTFQLGCLGAITPNATSYLAPGNGATQVNEVRVRVPRPGLLKNLHVWQRVASGAAGRTDIYTVRVNGGDTAIICTLDNATEGEDTTNTVLVAAGDQVSIKLVSNNAADTSADVTATLELT